MKLLSIAIPCYNSEAYMEKCIESLLKGGEEVEILVVNDGSSDRTAEIADTYAEKYPTIIKAIHQENGGHGEAVNAGIRNATGLYFKVVDSDDWVNEEAYKQILKTLEELTRGPKTLDMLISNFVYEKQGASRKKVMQYRHCLPVNEIFGWDSVHMSKGKYLLMHSIIYRTKLLHECGLELPKHTFYVDNLFAFEPLPFVKNMYYLDVIVVDSLSKPKVLCCLPTAFFGKHTHFNGIHIFRCKKIDIHSEFRLAVHKDGESAGLLHDFSVCMEPKQIHMIS